MFEISVKGIDGLERYGARLDAAVEKALDRTAEVVHQAKLQQVQKTYSREIPISRTGRARWKRSGDWLEGQTVERTPGERKVTTVGNATKYERRLANLPRGAGGINRTNKASEAAVKITAPQVDRVFDSELKNALGD